MVKVLGLMFSLLLGWQTAWAAPADDAIPRNRRRQAQSRASDKRQGPRLPASVQFHGDIAYADTDNPRQALDLLLPRQRATDAPLPVIAYIHGGAWRAGNKRGGVGRIARFVETGRYACVSIGYRLSQEAIWPAQIHDCKAAIRWLRGNAEKYGLNPDRIAVWGHSAGGHLVAMLGVSHGVADLEGTLGKYTKVSSKVHCVVDCFGPTDFLRMGDFPSTMDHMAPDSPESKLVGGPVKEKKEAVRSASPITHVTRDDAPFLMLHGDQDPLVPYNQSERLQAALEKVGVSSLLVKVVGGKHGFRSDEVNQRIVRFFRKHLWDQDIPVSGAPIQEGASAGRRRTDAAKARASAAAQRNRNASGDASAALSVSFIGRTQQQSFVYKQVGDRKLVVHVHYPPDWKQGDKRPGMIFFFGGGWSSGKVSQFREQAEYFALRGIVTAIADYRVKSRDGVTPDACVADARSAIRWMRGKAGELGMDPDKLITSGGSAGGHLAACAIIKESVESETDDLSVPTMPCAMVLFNPVLDFEQESLLSRLNNDQTLSRRISPLFHLNKDTPPALIVFGTKDRLKAHGDAYWTRAKKLGIRAEAHLADGQGHGFFNRSPWRERTLLAADRFLASLGLLPGKPLKTLVDAVQAPGVFGSWLKELGLKKDICVVLGLPGGSPAGLLQDIAMENDLLLYCQLPDPEVAETVRRAAEARGWLGKRVFVEEGSLDRIGVADNLAGALFISPAVRRMIRPNEVQRVVYPGGRIHVGGRTIVNPEDKKTDSWSHPYHGPDNNPQSTDQRARTPYLTQFLADPKFCPMPEISVAAGGKVFRAFGHIAHKKNQNPMLNTLICASAFNGRILWTRPLKENFMIHRNTMIATPEILYMADDQSCKCINTATGEVQDEIKIPEGMADGPVWKWMGMNGEVLVALIGGPEVAVRTQPSSTPGLGHWPWGMWDGHDYRDPKTSFGFGRTFVGIDPDTRKVLWHRKVPDYVDSRGVCMKGGRLYFYVPERYLACLDVNTQKMAWQTSSEDLLAAIGPNGRAQHYVTGYATTTYIKCNDDFIFFAGPQRSHLVVASAADGKLLFQKPHGNLQLVLREDGFYAAGPQGSGTKYAYETWEVLAKLPHRRACTRATGSLDSIFFRTPGGTVRIKTDDNTAHHIAPMRPPCQDGVIISDGHLFWGPWMCGCQLSLYGHIALASAGGFDFSPPVDAARLETGPGDGGADAGDAVKPGDWPAYMGNNARVPHSRVKPSEKVALKKWTGVTKAKPTAPVVAGDVVYLADRAGVVYALDRDGRLKWKAYTGGAIYFPPAVAQGRVFAGSADGWVYALAARTGERLWRFRVGPACRRIPVYGKLVSTWPVAGGVAVQGGVVYAAAGIAHYDGTYVVALDAATGKVKWYNDTSGTLSEKVSSGISLQGNLSIRGNELCFAGGGVYQTARYDLATGKCLNQPFEGVNSRFQTAFYAYFPFYAQYQSLHYGYPDGRILRYHASYEGSQHTRLELLGPAPKAKKAMSQAEQRRNARTPKPKRPVIWQDKTGARFHGFVVTPDVLLAAGIKDPDKKDSAFVAAVQIADGKVLWHERLPAPAVKGGIALDGRGRIVVVLENGAVVLLNPVNE